MRPPRRVACACLVLHFGGSLALTGCVLPDYENGPPPAGNTPEDAGPTDGPYEWPPLPDVEEPDGADAHDVTTVDAADVADVVQEPPVEAGLCETQPDGTICGPGGLCHEQVCQAGACVTTAVPDGVECEAAPNACWEPGRCQGGTCASPKPLADGYNWDPADTWRRCCGGQPLRMDTNTNCGVCGIQCNAADGQSCKANPVNGLYYCEGCNASAACWSGCCSTSFGQPYRCAASDCDGNCIACPGTSTCVASGGQASLACVYP